MQAGDVKICQRPFRKKLKPIEGLPAKDEVTWEVVAVIPFEGSMEKLEQLVNQDSDKE